MIATILAIGLSYFTFFITTALMSPFATLSVITDISVEYLYPILYKVSVVLMLPIALAIFRIKRLRKGMPFLLQKVPVPIGIFIGCAIICLTTLLTILDKNNSSYGIFAIFCSVITFVLFFWWRKQLSIVYINKAHQNEVDRLKTELDSIRQDNERLGAIIHKDNKLIPAMMMSVQTALSAQLHSGDDNNFELNALLSELEALYTERSTLSQAQLSAKCPLPESKLIRLDMMLKYMYQKSENLGIQMTADFQIDIKEMLSKQFSEDFLVTIVADLIDNAIIATNLSSEYKKIHIDFAKENDNYCIAVYDTGIPFELHTIKYAGIKKASTHLDNGGSGIGLMSTFTLLKDSYSSFVIDETIDKDNYTKKVAIVMDRLNEYRVYTQRPDILALRTSNPNITFCS